MVRLDKNKVRDLNIDKLFVRTSEGMQIPVSEVASIDLVNGPLQINRDATKRRVAIGVNVRDADIQQVVSEIRESLDRNVKLQPGYYFEYGGQFENLQSVAYSLVVFSTVPLSLIGGIVALWLRGLPFSISAGVGFIALFGVAVLNGILMINHFNDLRKKSRHPMCTDRIIFAGCPHLLRPVFLTGLVASLGFVPMAIAKTAGAEVQRPLATVVIGGLIVSTVLTLIIIPVFYHIVNKNMTLLKRRRGHRNIAGPAAMAAVIFFLGFSANAGAQTTSEGTGAQTGSEEAGVHTREVTLDEALEIAMHNHPRLQMASAGIDRSRAGKLGVWEGGNTSATYSWGQINGIFSNDNELEIEQSLGSPLTPFYKNALVNTQIERSGHYKEMVRKEIIAEVKRAWYYYQYAFQVKALYDGQEELTRKLRESAELRYEQGDIDLAEKNMISATASGIHTRWIQASEELKLAARRFTWSCYAKEDIIPDTSSLEPIDFNEGRMPLSQDRLDYLSMEAQEAKDMLNVERSRYFPEIVVGYTRKRIFPEYGLNSWTIGIPIPILSFSQHSRTRQAKADMEIAQWQAQDNIKKLNNRVEELYSQLAQQQKTLDYYMTAALKESETLQESALRKYQESETDITSLVQSLESSWNIRESFIKEVYNYNVSVLEIELYTDQAE